MKYEYTEFDEKRYEEAQKISEALGYPLTSYVRVVGSTALKIGGKDIIDLAMVSTDLTKDTQTLLKKKWRMSESVDVTGRLLFINDTSYKYKVHLHVFTDMTKYHDMCKFVNRLQEDAHLRGMYSDLKRMGSSLACREPTYQKEIYGRLKQEFIKLVLEDKL